MISLQKLAERPILVGTLIVTMAATVGVISAAWTQVGWIAPVRIHEWREFHEAEHAMAKLIDDCEDGQGDIENLQRANVYHEKRGEPSEAWALAKSKLTRLQQSYIQKQCASILMVRQ